MNTFYFIRHAEPDHLWTEDSTRPLSTDGMNDRYLLIEYFRDKKIDSIFSSPYKRAFETVKPVADYLKLEIFIDERLKERKSGEDSNNRKLFYKRWEDLDFAEFNGESIRNVQKRNIDFINEVMEKNNGKNIVVGTHGTALSSILNYYNKEFKCDEFLRIINYMPFIVKIEINDNENVRINEEYFIEKEYLK